MDTYVLGYLGIISLLAVILTVHDKNAARKGKWRIKERKLLFISVLGGSAAMLLTMIAIHHKTRRMKFMLGIPLIIVIQVLITVFVFDSSLSVSRFEFETDKIDGQIKLALITDLHSCDYGEGQSVLINAIDAESPNAVLLCGDIYDDVMPPKNATEFISGISKKYKCYYVSGNHELWSDKADKFKEILESYGVKVLEGDVEILAVNGQRIRICGIDDPETDWYPSRSVAYSEQISKLEAESEKEDLFTVLLSHRPERIEELLPLSPDLVLSGHAHGGQWRFPALLENGLYAPNQGLFPKYTSGKYSFGSTTLLVSRGLARESTKVVPRVFNRPEVVVITLS